MNLKTEKWMDHEIRFVEIDGEWWGVAKDVADALGYSDTHAMTRHMNDKYLKTVRLTGVKNNATAITEMGIYKAIMRSQRPEAEMLVQREPILEDIVELMAVKDKFGLDLSVSDEVYKKHVN